jgi:hypothetical protein
VTALWWAGIWGLDPSRSDDPTVAIERAYVAPMLTGGEASQMSPDGGAVDNEAERTKLVYETLAMLGVSGRLSLTPAADGAIGLEWGGGEPLALVPGKWTKVVPEEGDRYRIRVTDFGDQLVVERRSKTTILTETLLEPKGVEHANELVAVVRIDGSSIDPGVEFRRIYRHLDQ